MWALLFAKTSCSLYFPWKWHFHYHASTYLCHTWWGNTSPAQFTSFIQKAPFSPTWIFKQSDDRMNKYDIRAGICMLAWLFPFGWKTKSPSTYTHQKLWQFIKFSFSPSGPWYQAVTDIRSFRPWRFWYLHVERVRWSCLGSASWACFSTCSFLKGRV